MSEFAHLGVPVPVDGLVARERAALLALLDGLEPGAWGRPTWAPGWDERADALGVTNQAWVHQQQIRGAVGRPELTERDFLHPVLDTFLRALPATFADADTAWRLFSRSIAPDRARSAIRIAGDRELGERVATMVSVIA